MFDVNTKIVDTDLTNTTEKLVIILKKIKLYQFGKINGISTNPTYSRQRTFSISAKRIRGSSILPGLHISLQTI